MAIETATYIDSLVAANPTSGDSTAQGDDHIRLIKSVLKSTFPNITGPVTLTQAEINGGQQSAAKTVKGNIGTTSAPATDLTVTDLRNLLGLANGAFQGDGTYAPAVHNHDGVYAPVSHVHPASEINSGVLNAARLPAATTSAQGAVRKATTAEMNAGTVNRFPDAAAVKALIGGGSQKAQNGWVDLPGGIIVQWGKVSTPANANQTYNFPKEFPTTCYAIVSQPEGNAASYDFEVDYYSNGCKIVNRKSFTIINEGTSTPVTSSWYIAIGS